MAAAKPNASKRPARRAANGRAPLVGEVVEPAEPTRVVVVNLAEMRAERSRTQPVIIDQNGVEHRLGGISLDAYLALLEIETEYKELKTEEDRGVMKRQRQIDLLTSMRETVVAILPTFPCGGLYLDELYLVAQAVQRSVQPARVQDIPPAGDGDAPGN